MSTTLFTKKRFILPLSFALVFLAGFAGALPFHAQGQTTTPLSCVYCRAQDILLRKGLTTFEGGNFDEDNYSWGNIRNKNVSHASFVNAILQNFTGDSSNFKYTDFTGIYGGAFLSANISHAIFKNSEGISTMSNSTAQNANFVNSNLNGGSTNNADFTGSNFKKADLSGAGFQSNNFTSTDFTNTNLTNTDLTNSNFTNANLTGATTTDAIFTGVTWNNTTCPDGTNSNDDGNTCVGHL